MARVLPYEIKQQIDFEIRGFHVYRSKWKPRLWQPLFVLPENYNPYDRTALAVTDTDQTYRGGCSCSSVVVVVVVVYGR